MARRDRPVNMPPWLPFTVDSWDRTSCHRKRHHFLTHAHTDHMSGLATFKTTDRTIYCSRTTRDLVVRHFPQLSNAQFCYLEVDGGELILEDKNKEFNISVRAFDANHCPGAIMLLFYIEDHGYVLHTGDARLAEARVVRPVKAFLRRRPLECLYMDCTYGDKAYPFPTKEDAVRQVCDVIARHTEDGQQVVLACDQLGMEEVLEGVFAKFGSGFWIDHSNASASARTWWDDLRFMHPEWLVTDPTLTRFHLCDGRALGRRAEDCRQRCSEAGTDPPVFIRPSSQFFVHGEDVAGDSELAREKGLLPPVGAWQQPVAARQDPFGIYRVLYSMHSSKSELMRAVEILAPRHVVHFVGEMGLDLRTVVGKVTGGYASSTWLGPVRQDPAPGREPREKDEDSEDDSAETSSREETPKKKGPESPGVERPGGFQANGVDEGEGGQLEVGEERESGLDATPSLAKWDDVLKEAPPSPPLSFASSQREEEPAEDDVTCGGASGPNRETNEVCQEANEVCQEANEVCQEANEVCQEANEVCQEANEVCQEASGRLSAELVSCRGSEERGAGTGRGVEHQESNGWKSTLHGTHSEHRAHAEATSPRQYCAGSSLRNGQEGSPAKENIPPETGGFINSPGHAPKVVEVVGLPLSARLKGGSPDEGAKLERGGAGEAVGGGRESEKPEEGGSPERCWGREASGGVQNECRGPGVSSGGSGDGEMGKSEPAQGESSRSGCDRSALKRKASSLRSPARAIPKNGAIYRAFERRGVPQPIPLPHQKSRLYGARY